ncbi:hypothetical protein RJ639_033759, partial [Escallonia herrerae]
PLSQLLDWISFHQFIGIENQFGILNVFDPTDALKMIPWDGCKAKQIAFAPRTDDYVSCKRCESDYPTYFLSVRVYLWLETTRSMGLAH